MAVDPQEKNPYILRFGAAALARDLRDFSLCQPLEFAVTIYQQIAYAEPASPKRGLFAFRRCVMPIDKSLKVKAGAIQNRNVLSRAERIEKLKEADRFNDASSVLGLPKVRVLKISMKKKKKVKAEEGDAKGAKGAKGAAPAKGAPKK